MRLPRMTTRRWTVTVVIVGLMMGAIIGGYRLKRGHDEFQARARAHTWWEADWKNFEARTSKALLEEKEARIKVESWRDRIAVLEEMIEDCRRRAVYHATMARKYRHAARYPWLDIEPDPPEPEDNVRPVKPVPLVGFDE